jgi:hypothetical protein
MTAIAADLRKIAESADVIKRLRVKQKRGAIKG